MTESDLFLFSYLSHCLNEKGEIILCLWYQIQKGESYQHSTGSGSLMLKANT